MSDKNDEEKTDRNPFRPERRDLTDTRERNEIWLWAKTARAKEIKRAKMWESVKTSALGHLTWIVLVVLGTAIWEFVKGRVKE